MMNFLKFTGSFLFGILFGSGEFEPVGKHTFNGDYIPEYKSTGGDGDPGPK